MAEPRFTMTADDDLPRTFRREKEAREREARERDGVMFQAPQDDDTADFDYGADDRDEPENVAVTRLDIPFFHLMLFLHKSRIRGHTGDDLVCSRLRPLWRRADCCKIAVAMAPSSSNLS